MRKRQAARTTFRFTLLLLLLLLVNVVTVAVGQSESRLTVANLTGRYVHVFVDGESYLYVAPDRSVTHATEAKPTMLVEVVYAPGQGIRGALVDTVTVPYRGSSSGCTCEENDTECMYEPPAGGSARIEVMAADMETSP